MNIKRNAEEYKAVKKSAPKIEEYVDYKLQTAMVSLIEKTCAHPESALQLFNIDEDKYGKFRPKLEEAYNKLENPNDDKYTKSLAMGIYKRGFRVGILSVFITDTMKLTNNYNLREIMNLFGVRENEIDEFQESVNECLKEEAEGRNKEV